VEWRGCQHGDIFRAAILSHGANGGFADRISGPTNNSSWADFFGLTFTAGLRQRLETHKLALRAESRRFAASVDAKAIALEPEPQDPLGDDF